MDIHEARLLDRLNDYQKIHRELQECTEDIEELLLLYDFDIESISQKFPVIKTIQKSSSHTPSKRIRAFFSK